MTDQIEIGEYIQGTFNFFNSKFVDPTLDAVIRDAKAALASITRAMKAFLADPVTPVHVEAVDTSVVKRGLPQLRWITDQPAPLGGVDGGPFVDDPTSIAARDRIRISKVELWYSRVIDGIRTTYLPPGAGVKPMVVAHGITEKTAYNSLEIPPGDFVKEIVARTGNRVDSMKIHTRFGMTLEAGAKGGEKDATTPNSTALLDPNKFVIGFHGRSGVELDAIGVVMATFVKCDWTGFLSA